MSEWRESDRVHQIQVSRWTKDADGLEFMLRDFRRQRVSHGLYCRDNGSGLYFAVFRERLPGDPAELEDQSLLPRYLVEAN